MCIIEDEEYYEKERLRERWLRAFKNGHPAWKAYFAWRTFRMIATVYATPRRFGYRVSCQYKTGALEIGNVRYAPTKLKAMRLAREAALHARMT